MKDVHAALLIAVMSLVTLGLRSLPFLLFRGDRPVPKVILYLGKVLPSAALGMLVVYCLRDLQVTSLEAGLCPILACGAVALIQFFGKNTVLSILSGTLFYMVLIRIF